jgi:hypothetical protein
MFEVREKEVRFESVSSDKAARVLGAGKIAAIRNHVLWGGGPICHRMWQRTGVREATQSRASVSPSPGEGTTPEQPGLTENIPPAKPRGYSALPR